MDTHQKTDFLRYDVGDGAEAFTSMVGTELPYRVITGHQVHSDKVALVDDPLLTREDLEGFDALVTALPGCAVGVRTADCIPLLLFDPVCRAVAAVHSGWKGTVLRIVQKTIADMEGWFGTSASNLRAVIGPGICANSFQVGSEVCDRFSEAGFPMQLIWREDGVPEPGSMRGGHHIDLFAANMWLLEEAGVKSRNIQLSGICTYLDERFHSARREGAACGRITSWIRLV